MGSLQRFPDPLAIDLRKGEGKRDGRRRKEENKGKVEGKGRANEGEGDIFGP